MFDGVFGGRAAGIVRPTFNRNGGLPKGHGEYESVPQLAAPQNATVNAGTATINVTSASINGAGGGFNAAGAPSSAVSAIAGGGYAPTGNGSYFNLGSSPAASSGNGEMGSAASGSPFGQLSDSASGFGSAATSGTGSTGFGSSVTGAYNDIQGGFSQANSLGKDLGIFGKDANGNNAGLASKIPGIKNLSPETMGKLGGVAGGAMTVYSAFEGKGGWGGAAQGALGGAEAGMQYGGLAGAAIGAVIGGVLGFIGHGARVKAQQYYWKELRPKIESEMLGFEAGTADYQGVYDDLTKSDTEAKQKTREMGSGAESYYNDTIHPDLMKYQQRLTREAKAGRAQFGMSAAQFHMGGRISTFGSMATSADEGWFHGKLGETVLNQQATMSHGDVAALMNAGTSRSEIAEYLGGGNGAPQQQAVSSGDVHLHVHAIDAKGVAQFLDTYKHDIRNSLNNSYAENSGGAD